jgi:hypothetical protein
MIDSLWLNESEPMDLIPYDPKSSDVPFDLQRARKFTEYNDTLEQEKIAKIFDCVNKFALDQLKLFIPNSKELTDPYLAYFSNAAYDAPHRIGPVQNLQQMSLSKPSPYVVENWQKDEFFGEMTFNGSNPLAVERVTHLDQLKPQLLELKPEGHSLQALIDAKRLFVIDYGALAPYAYPK